MAISVRCGECDKTYSVKDEAAGKRMTCKSCGVSIKIPNAKVLPADDDFDDYEPHPNDDADDEERVSSASRPQSRVRKTAKSRTKQSSSSRPVWLIGGALGVVALLTVVGLAVSRSGRSVPGAGWVEFAPPDGSFRIRMPAVPKVETQTAGTTTSHKYTCETGGSACVVETSNLAAAMQAAGASLSTPGVAESFLANMAADLRLELPGSLILNDTPTTFGNFPGREVEIEVASKGLHNSIRLYICGTNYFSLQFVWKRGASRPADADIFFNSFQPAAGTGATGVPAATPVAAVASNPNEPYLKRRAAFQTRLLKQAPAPQDWKPEPPPVGVREVTYPSGKLLLKAWVAEPTESTGTKPPALVYFHGGFGFGGNDFKVCEPFRQAGYVVMTPMLRGENGNPGNFELMWGEVDDAKAAIKWLAEQPYVDGKRIYAFGHSAGGGIACLLSLHDDVPLRHSGSSGGLYSEAVARRAWANIAPFDSASPDEYKLRVLVGNVQHMKRSHFAIIGLDDSWIRQAQAQAESTRFGSKLTVLNNAGDHFKSLPSAVEFYLKNCNSDSESLLPPAERAILIGKRAEQMETAAETSRTPAFDLVEAAEAWLATGNNDRALATAKKADAAGPEARNDLLAHYWHRRLADLYLKTGEPKQAIPHYETAIEKTDIKFYIDECRKSLAEAKAKAGD